MGIVMVILRSHSHSHSHSHHGCVVLPLPGDDNKVDGSKW